MTVLKAERDKGPLQYECVDGCVQRRVLKKTVSWQVPVWTSIMVMKKASSQKNHTHHPGKQMLLGLGKQAKHNYKLP